LGITAWRPWVWETLASGHAKILAGGVALHRAGCIVARRVAWADCCALPGKFTLNPGLLLGDSPQRLFLSTLQIVLGQFFEFWRTGDHLVRHLLFHGPLDLGLAFPGVVLLLAEPGNSRRPFASVPAVGFVGISLGLKANPRLLRLLPGKLGLPHGGRGNGQERGHAIKDSDVLDSVGRPVSGCSGFRTDALEFGSV
jgi:hypothetical protein